MLVSGRIVKEQYLIVMQIQYIQFGQIFQAAYLIDSVKDQKEVT